jgi:hypothetical protein
MENKPGISWGVYEPLLLPNGKPHGTSCRINLMRSSKGWLAVYYDNPEHKGEVIKIFKPTNMVEYLQMLDTLALWNYGTCELCPIVKADMDATA